MPVNHAKAVQDFRRRERTINEGAPPAEFVELRRANRDYLPDWLRAFMPEAFQLEFSPDHIEMLELGQEVIVNGGMYAIAMSRGMGKTTSMGIGAVLWGMLEGHIRYGVQVGSDGGSSKEMLEAVKSQLLNNEIIQKAYSPVTGWLDVVPDGDGYEFKSTGYIAAGHSYISDFFNPWNSGFLDLSRH